MFTARHTRRTPAPDPELADELRAIELRAVDAALAGHDPITDGRNSAQLARGLAFTEELAR